MNRHEEACETIWLILEGRKMVSNTMEAQSLFDAIEQVLTMTESRIQEDQEAQYEAFKADLNAMGKEMFHV